MTVQRYNHNERRLQIYAKTPNWHQAIGDYLADPNVIMVPLYVMLEVSRFQTYRPCLEKNMLLTFITKSSRSTTKNIFFHRLFEFDGNSISCDSILPFQVATIYYSQLRIDTVDFLFQFNSISWWRHQMETFSALLATCAGNSPVPGALMFSLICVWINDSVNNREAGDLRCYRAHYHAIVMFYSRQRSNKHIRFMYGIEINVQRVSR